MGIVSTRFTSRLSHPSSKRTTTHQLNAHAKQHAGSHRNIHDFQRIFMCLSAFPRTSRLQTQVVVHSFEFNGQNFFIYRVRSNSVRSSPPEDSIFLDTALLVLATPPALPSTGFSFPPLSLLPTIRPSSRIAYTVLDPRVYPTCFLSQPWPTPSR